MKEREKRKKEPSLTSMHQMVLEIPHPKFRNLNKMDVAILLMFSLIFIKYDDTDATCNIRKK